jgi:HlyD family secretion protein
MSKMQQSVVGSADDPPSREKPLDREELRIAVQGPVRAGMKIILLFGFAFCIWGLLVPLDGGAVAPGVFNPVGSKRTIQHLEGGIISELLVREGDNVDAQQPLVVIENVQARATHDALLQQRLSLLAKQARLEAERADADHVEWPAVLQSTEAKIRGVRDAEEHIFDTRRAAHAAKKSVLRQRIEQLAEQIKGYQAQVESATRQLDFIDEEIQAKQALLAKGLVSKPEYLSRKRVDAEVAGRRGEYIADIARLRQQIAENEMQLLSADAERADQIANQADKVRADLTDVIEKFRGNDDILKRTVIAAPVNGAILNLKFKTIGGVVQRGEPILEIVPSDDLLVVDARVTPLDVKAVRKGLEAKIHLSAYSARATPRVPGIVQSVSADRLVDEITRQSYYLVRIAVNRETLTELAPNVDLVAGMPAEVLIVTERRTMMDYLLKPFRDAFRRSFHEV